MLRYSIAMAIRVACIVAVFPLPGWWKALPALGAILLPYLAVVAANQTRSVAAGATAYRRGELPASGRDGRDV